MSYASTSLSDRKPAALVPRKSLSVAVLAAWFLAVILLGAADRFVGPPGAPPVAVAIGFALPIVIFLAAVRTSLRFREFLYALDVRVLVGAQAWRFLGLGFIGLYAHGVLPGSFALPAGLGDIAIALTAPWMLSKALAEPRFIASRGFLTWNLLGLLDLFAAVGTGALMTVVASVTAGTSPTAAMAELPLVIVPVYLVPLFVMIHVASIMHGRREARGARQAVE